MRRPQNGRAIVNRPPHPSHGPWPHRGGRPWRALAALAATLFPATPARAQNPILDEGSADPSVRVFGGRAYLYGSHDFEPGNRTWVMRDWKVYSSADLVTWTDHGVALDDDTLAWRGVADRAFAPDAIFHGGQYYFYFSLGDGTIGVAAGVSPAGPFVDVLGKPLVDQSATPAFDIDPTAFEDADGAHYLVWGNGACYLAELGDDMKSFKSVPREVVIVGAPGYMEGPFLWRYGGRYYLLYSRCGSTCSDTLDYAVASSVWGPYTYEGTIIGHCKAGNEHGSVFELNGQWYVAYHDLYPTTYYRKARLERLHYANDGRIPRVYPTDDGVGRHDGARPIEAEDYFDRAPGLRYEDCADTGGGFHVTGIANGGWLAFPRVDLGPGADAFWARVAASSGASAIEIRLGGAEGPLAGTCEVPGGDGSWTTVGAKLAAPLAGVHDVFLRFRGAAPAELFALNWVRFASSVDGGVELDGAAGPDGPPRCAAPPAPPSGCSCGVGGRRAPGSRNGRGWPAGLCLAWLLVRFPAARGRATRRARSTSRCR